MATTFQQNRTNADLLLDANKRLVLEPDPVVAAAIKLRNRFWLAKGEWWADTRIGTPYLDVILGIKNPNLAVIRRVIRRIILSCPPISDVKTLNMTFDKGLRTLVFYFEATATDGRIIRGGTNAPFIVSDS